MMKPLVLVGGLPLRERDSIAKILASWKRALYLEAHSQLRGHVLLRDHEIVGGEKSLSEIEFDGVIRIGGVPTVKMWRNLEKSDWPVLNFSHLPFSGLPRERQVQSLASLQDVRYTFQPWSEAERKADRERQSHLTSQFEKYPLSEPGWFRWLSQEIPNHSRVYIGNSLPIREWDLAAEREKEFQIFANRGVNGIDGQISTFFGVAEPGRSNWCIIGDLTAMYDLTSPWVMPQLSTQDLNIVIINNGGGRIFQRMFNNPLFENRHSLSFEGWAKMWNLDYCRLAERQSLPSVGRPQLIEVIPSETQTEQFWKDLI